VPTQSVNPLPATAQNMATVAYTQRYVELLRLVNKQRDTITAQQADLTKVRHYFVFVINIMLILLEIHNVNYSSLMQRYCIGRQRTGNKYIRWIIFPKK